MKTINPLGDFKNQPSRPLDTPPIPLCDTTGELNKQTDEMSFSPLLLYVTLPLWLAPHRGGVLNISDREKKYLVMLRDTAEEKGIYISLSPPVFCAAKYRGSARRAKGLIQTKNSLPNTSPLFGDEDARK